MEPSHAEGARGAHAFFEILNVCAERGKNERACNVDPSCNAMKFCEPLPKAI